MTGRKIKCKFCDWSPPIFRTNSNGRIKSGFPMLQDHVMQEHPVQWSLIQYQIEEEKQWDQEPK